MKWSVSVLLSRSVGWVRTYVSRCQQHRHRQVQVQERRRLRHTLLHRGIHILRLCGDVSGVSSLNTRVQRIWPFFDKVEPLRPEMDVKWNSKTQIKSVFRFSFSFRFPFRPRLALKLLRAKISKICFMHKFDMGVIKCKIRCRVRIRCKNKYQKVTQESYKVKDICTQEYKQKNSTFLSHFC